MPESYSSFRYCLLTWETIRGLDLFLSFSDEIANRGSWQEEVGVKILGTHAMKDRTRIDQSRSRLLARMLFS